MLSSELHNEDRCVPFSVGGLTPASDHPATSNEITIQAAWLRFIGSVCFDRESSSANTITLSDAARPNGCTDRSALSSDLISPTPAIVRGRTSACPAYGVPPAVSARRSDPAQDMSENNGLRGGHVVRSAAVTRRRDDKWAPGAARAHAPRAAPLAADLRLRAAYRAVTRLPSAEWTV